MGYQFDAETEIVTAGELRWTTHLTSNWNIGDNPNGGYLTAPLIRAMRDQAETTGHPDPMSVTTHFLRPGTGDADAVIDVEPVRIGRTLSTMQGRLTQGDRTRVETVAAFTDLSNTDSRVELTIEPVTLPDPDDCVNRKTLEQGVELPILNRVDVRVHPDHAVAGENQRAEIDGWIRFSDERPVDTHALTLFVDAFPPPVFSLVGHIGWVPTIELTVHVRRRPVSGWIRGHFEVTDIIGNRMIEDGILWDASGAVVARSRQVALILSPGE